MSLADLLLQITAIDAAVRLTAAICIIASITNAFA